MRCFGVRVSAFLLLIPTIGWTSWQVSDTETASPTTSFNSGYQQPQTKKPVVTKVDWTQHPRQIAVPNDRFLQTGISKQVPDYGPSVESGHVLKKPGGPTVSWRVVDASSPSLSKPVRKDSLQTQVDSRFNSLLPPAPLKTYSAGNYKSNSPYSRLMASVGENPIPKQPRPARFAISVSGSLKENITQIMARYHWKVIWNAPYDFNFDGRMTGNSLPNVIQKLLKPFPLQAVMYLSNRTMTIVPRNT